MSAWVMASMQRGAEVYFERETKEGQILTVAHQSSAHHWPIRADAVARAVEYNARLDGLDRWYVIQRSEACERTRGAVRERV